jgi:hypothetical protein
MVAIIVTVVLATVVGRDDRDNRVVVAVIEVISR